MNLVRFAIAFSLAVLQSACAATSVPLATTAGSNAPAAHHNAEGIAEYDRGQWGMARYHFGTAILHDRTLAEAHFNLALALHKLDLHSEATTHFKKAAELAPSNSAITQSRAYKKHTAPPSSLSSFFKPANKSPDWTSSPGTKELHYEIYRSP